MPRKNIDCRCQYRVLELLTSLLKEHFQTYEAMGVQEAIKLLENVTVDAICSDFNMCDGTGLELLKMMRQQDVKIPFMLMSAYLANKVQSWGALFSCKTDHAFLSKNHRNGLI